MRTMPHTLLALCFMAFACVPLSTTAHAAALVASDQGGGYSGQVLEKVSKVWQAPHDPSERTVRIRVSIDGDGKVVSCVPVASSNLPILDKSACTAVNNAEKFSTPPYGMPIDVYLTFWTGWPKGGSGYTPPSMAENSAPTPLAAQNAQSANAVAIALAKAAEARAVEATGKGKAEKPSATAPATVAGTEEIKNTEPLVGLAGDAANPDELRYAKKVRRAIRENMVVPAELPKGKYYVTLRVHVSGTGQLTKAEITQPSTDPLMDKYALRAIKRTPTVPVPPSKKLQDLYLTFVLQRQ